jgi:hypothetical protein
VRSANKTTGINSQNRPSTAELVPRAEALRQYPDAVVAEAADRAAEPSSSLLLKLQRTCVDQLPG